MAESSPFKQFKNGTVLIGGGHPATPYQDRNDGAGLEEPAISARTVFELFPVMRDATIMRAWAGIEAKMKDDIPVFGPSSRHKGLYHQFGFSLHGRPPRRRCRDGGADRRRHPDCVSELASTAFILPRSSNKRTS